jgi:hypothetical protein
MKLNYLSNMTYKQVERLATKTDTALFPIAPTEAHGTHLPMSVDAISADEITQRAAKKLKAMSIETLIRGGLYILDSIGQVLVVGRPGFIRHLSHRAACSSKPHQEFCCQAPDAAACRIDQTISSVLP